MDVQTAEAWSVQRRLGQDQAVGGGDGGIEIERVEGALRLQIAAKAGRCTDGQSQIIGRDVDWATADRLTSAGRSSWLTIDRRDVMAIPMERP